MKKKLAKITLIIMSAVCFSCGSEKPKIDCTGEDVVFLVKEIVRENLSKSYSIIRMESDLWTACNPEYNGEEGCIFNLNDFQQRKYYDSYLYNNLLSGGKETTYYKSIYDVLTGIKINDIITVKKAVEENVCECEATVEVDFENVDTEHIITKEYDFTDVANKKISYKAFLTDDLTKTRVRMGYHPNFDTSLLIYPTTDDVISKFDEYFDEAF